MDFSKLLYEIVKIGKWISITYKLKVLNESKYSMPLVGCACGNVLSLIQKVKSFEILFYATVAKTAKHFRSIELCTSLAKNNLCPNPL